MPEDYEDAIKSLLSADNLVPNWQLQTHLKVIHKVVPKYGLTSENLNQLIELCCATSKTNLSEDSKIKLIEKSLFPNGFLTQKTIDLIISHLGTNTILTSSSSRFPSKEIQIALCKWLVHVSILIPKQLMNMSTWFHLWQFEYIQKWITLIIVWFTTDKNQINPWKLIIMENITSKTMYKNSKVYATLILKRYLTILGQSNRIQGLISKINCDVNFLNVLQHFQFEEEFLRKLRHIVVKNSPFNFTKKSIIKSFSFKVLQLQDKVEVDKNVPLANYSHDKRIMKLNYIFDHSNTEMDEIEGEIPLDEIDTLNALVRHWNRIVLPKSGQRLFSNERTIPMQLYPLSLSSENEEFWVKMYDWIFAHLQMCFKDKKLQLKDRISLFDNVMKSCQLYDTFTWKVIDDFLTLEYLSANKDLFLSICTILFPIIECPDTENPEKLKEFRKKFRRIITICNLSKEDGHNSKKRWSSSQNTTVSVISNSIITMVRTWMSAPTDVIGFQKVLFSLEILNELRKLLISNINHSIENRHTIISTILLLNLLSFIALKFQKRFNSKSSEKDVADEALKKIILTSGTINKLCTLDDPLILDACCHYLVSIKGLLIYREPDDIYVQLQNKYILNITTYLWRNKIFKSKKIFDIPTKFLKDLIKNIYLPTLTSKNKALFSMFGIASTSYIPIAALHQLEKDNNCKVHYKELLNEEGFNKFSKKWKDKTEWLPEILSFDEFKEMLLKQISGMDPYKNIALFLFTYLKSLSHYIENRQN
ncbi:Ctf3p NDAI_0J02160 [Naumovozyma dairenensis CBS 421]|uniref:Uncharacterized protein n=1 Tax=Naumovozyma dairenensis (strain ATCC 10597 / BCRC 20456 / CBS 421 / NBRC 0211 / NRRL Y-12639) TaxID=1071378 RepID=G0WH30_NAUDC|nr:hypothetical protein NDAI_0J02160 [Naumovozyma dairenensis CBS 421]CCD27108.1 hypothetical protein NDAI_0J02160 [Naumovozyma dairenensis CBS 421]